MPEIVRNKKVGLLFEIVDTFDAGLVLTGAEVKSVKGGGINLEGSYVRLTRQDEAILVGAKIAAYDKAGYLRQTYDPSRERKLLLTRRELLQIKGKIAGKGLTITPLSVYTTPSLVKVKIAIVRGKKKYDKRQTIKEREFKRKLNARVRR